MRMRSALSNSGVMTASSCGLAFAMRVIPLYDEFEWRHLLRRTSSASLE